MNNLRPSQPAGNRTNQGADGIPVHNESRTANTMLTKNSPKGDWCAERTGNGPKTKGPRCWTRRALPHPVSNSRRKNKGEDIALCQVILTGGDANDTHSVIAQRNDDRP